MSSASLTPRRSTRIASKSMKSENDAEIEAPKLRKRRNPKVEKKEEHGAVEDADSDDEWRLHSRPIHSEPRLTVLSTHNEKQVSYEGLYNLGGLVLILANFREVLVNIMKYGVLFNPLHFFWWFKDPYSWPGLTTFFSLGIYFALIFAIQNLQMIRLISPTLGRRLGLFVVSLCAIVSSVIVWVWIDMPLTGIFCTMSASIATMKLYSYVQVNHEEFNHWAANGYVRRKKKPKNAVRQYPENVSIRNMLFFLWVPTLCYQLDYPRAKRIMKRRVTRFLLQGAFLFGLIWVLAEQYMQPLLLNAVVVYREGNILWIAERLLKMTIPNLAIWLVGFYLIWEVILGLLSEVLRFDDRRFYDDWWNSLSLQYFWRTWNKPVHHFFLRHVFHPLEHYGFKQKHVIVFVFFISAVMHELVISLSFHTIGWWAFAALMVQPLLVALSKPLTKSWAGNVFFWITISMGQPFAVLMYCVGAPIVYFYFMHFGITINNFQIISIDYFSKHPLPSWKVSI